MKYHPLGDKVLVQVLSSEQSIGGLIIPDTSSNLKKGIVIGVGPGKPGNPTVLKEGQEVLFNKNDGTLITLDGEEYLIIAEPSCWLYA